MVTLNPLRWGEGRKTKVISRQVQVVNDLAPRFEAMSDDELKAMTPELKQRLEDGESLDDLLPEAFALVREAAWRVLHQRPYDVQVFGGIAIHEGNIAEMKTGEGKTLTSTMPVYLNALTGEGVHVVTVNEYLAKRDAEWMGAVHRFLGLTVGTVHSQQPKESKREAYFADITYGTTNEFGFDYLRDNMALSKEAQVQRGHHFALLDEVDSILIDEARTPLIISGPAEQSAQWYQIFARRIVPNLKKGEDLGEGETTGDYVIDEAKRTVGVTEEGIAKVEQLLGVDNLYESVNTPLVHHLQNGIKAKELFRRDDEYIVQSGEVKIVDQQTGRVLEGRRYSEGLHQAIEAKEGVHVKEENQTLATITLQNYYRTYDKLAGMTGTAKTEEMEFAEIYELGVVVVPTNEPMIRADRADLIYKGMKAKFEAVVEDIIERHEKGQPILIGTTSVEKSELLAGMLKRRGIPHEVLNAKQHAREAHIVAQAGRKGAVTVSTNMAGRGTDIVLGGNPEELAKDDVAKLPEDATEEQRQQTLEQATARYEELRRDEREHVLEAGGLYVIGTERHESRRIDNQLRGRSGRQGDPGESRFFLSLEDDLMRLFNAAAVERIMTRLNIPEDVPIEHKWVTKAVANAQRQVESRNFDIRKNVLKYDDVLNEQRKVVYGQRQRLIEGDHDAVMELAQKYVEDVIEGAVDQFAPPGVFPEEWMLDDLRGHLEEVYPCGYDWDGLDLERIERQGLVDGLIDDVFERYEKREQEVGGDQIMREVERRVILSVVDRKWREHLYEMDALRDGIGLRAVGQRDPLVEYQREAYDNFVAMMDSVKDEAVTYFFHLPVRREDEEARQAQEAAQRGEVKLDTGAAARVAVQSGRTGEAPAPTTAAPTPGGNGSGDGAAEKAIPGIRFEEPKQPARLSYSGTDENAGTGSAGASYTVGDGTATSASDGAPPPSPRQQGPARTDEGGTVRRIAAGGTYTKGDDEFANVGRNDPCPCGSGKKFKKCHGA
ncbi:MAG: preprotein translocase subunit SecA [Actinobacteria bacterium]|nr:preprotein translocase subunit SecA [Actinomycetota bacterium]